MDDFFQRRKTDEFVGDAIDDVFENGYLRDAIHDAGPDDLKPIIKRRWSCKRENEYLRDLLDWERAPLKIVYESMIERPQIIDARTASDEEVDGALRILVRRLREINHAIVYADHLSDRRLYRLIVRCVLPRELKFLPNAKNPVYWNFCPYSEDRDYDEIDERANGFFGSPGEKNWLTYYASDSRRALWLETVGGELPPKLPVPYPRDYLFERVGFY